MIEEMENYSEDRVVELIQPLLDVFCSLVPDLSLTFNLSEGPTTAALYETEALDTIKYYEFLKALTEITGDDYADPDIHESVNIRFMVNNSVEYTVVIFYGHQLQAFAVYPTLHRLALHEKLFKFDFYVGKYKREVELVDASDLEDRASLTDCDASDILDFMRNSWND